MTQPVLYKSSKKGKTQQWQVFTDGNTFYTVEGQVGGKLTTSKPTVCLGKNIGKKNETSPEDQAISEAKSKHQRKLDKGYSETLGEGFQFFEPMLAKDYKDKETGITYPWVITLMNNPKVRKFAQPKLDGLRTINQNGELSSRGGKNFVTCPHLTQDKVILDGELYNHEFKHDFNAIVSMIKQGKPSEEDLEHAKKYAQMWVYDFPGKEGVFSERYKALQDWFKTNKNPSLKLVETIEIKSEDDLKVVHKRLKALGYEGTIVRFDLADYEKDTRATQLVKYKDFIDEEFKILGYEEGKGGRAGTIGKFILQHDKDPNQTFKCNVKGNFDYLRKIWANVDDYVGKSATVQYFNRTPKKDKGGDVPRFGYVIKIDRESYE